MALENYDERPEMAFTLLISALESLLELRNYSEAELYDEELLSHLRSIESSCPNGAKLVKSLKGRLYQVKRKVAVLVDDYIPDSYFNQPEATLSCTIVKDRVELTRRIRAAYDIRSRLLHTGNRQGIQHIAHAHQGSEVVLGKPVLSDPETVKLLCRSLNLTGLERVTATVLRTAITRHFVQNTSTEI